MITIGDLQGHWRRDWIKAPEFEDATTRVNWLQAGTLFGDLRIPMDRPDTAGLTCLADMTPAALRALMEAEGFAGHITVVDEKCTWHRQINWHGVPEQSDIGLMSFDDAGGLIEDGVLAEYRELWQRLPQPDLRSRALRCGDLSGVVIENDAMFMLAIGGEPRGTTSALIQALDKGTAQTAALHAHFASTYVLGRWHGAQGIAALSTNPFCEGQVVLERAESLLWHSMAFDGHRAVQPLKPV